MKIVKVDLKELSYKVIIKQNGLDELPEFLKQLKRLPKKGVIVTNKKVFSFYKDIISNLQEHGFNMYVIYVPDGEQAKSLQWAEKIYHKLLKWKLNRESFLIALGGGVVGDLTGFVAATFLRGIPFIQIPTSLLAQVDSSVGGKVAVNLDEGKNLVGCFYQPKLVLIDPMVLKTLPKKEFKDGMAEVIKYGLIQDSEFFRFLLKNSKKIDELHLDTIEKVIYYSVKNKASVVSQDEKEKGLRAILNFGHTFGHAIEKTWSFKKFSHGQAVSIGMYMACLLSLEKGLLTLNEWEQIKPVFDLFNLPTTLKTDKGRVIFNNLFFDKKMTDRGLNYILIKKTGKVIQTKDVSISEIRNFILNVTR